MVICNITEELEENLNTEERQEEFQVTMIRRKRGRRQKLTIGTYSNDTVFQVRDAYHTVQQVKL